LSQRNILRTTAGALRAPWRILVFLVATAASTAVIGGTIGPLFTRLFTQAGAESMGAGETVTTLGLLAGTAIALRVVDRRPWRDVWLDRTAAGLPRLTLGFLLGALAIGVPTALLILTGWLREEPTPQGSWWLAMARISLTLIPAALAEELLSRGYLLSVLKQALGWRWAVTLTSAGFGMLHWWNPGATVASVAIVTLAGFFLAAVLYATQSLYAAWAAHFAWNWTMAALFHVAVSGAPFATPSYRYVDAGPDWATGGAWGPEGGLPAVLGMGGGVAFLFARRRRTTTPADHIDDTQEI
jgi:membrane protease YdiL (CAAX protease family)